MVPVVLIIALAGCTDSTRPPNPRRPDLLAGRVLPPPWADDVASSAFGFPLSVADAERILTRTKIFALGEMPPKRQVQGFNVLLDQTDALERFRQMIADAEPAGQLYALAALTMLSPSEGAQFWADDGHQARRHRGLRFGRCTTHPGTRGCVAHRGTACG
jgi:hypothetical protein